VILYDVQNNREIRISNAGINPKVWTEYDHDSPFPRMDNNARLSFGTTEYYAEICISYRTIGTPPYSWIRFIALSTNQLIFAASGGLFNNNTNLLPSTIKQNPDGSLTVEGINADGVKLSHTFTGW
jgi:hypothetical protein